MQAQNRSKRPYGTGTVRPHGKSWEGRFWFGPKRVSVNLGQQSEVTKKQAEGKLRKFIEAYKPLRPEQKITFAALGEKFIAHKESMNRSRSTMEAYRSTLRVHLEPAFGPREPNSITVEDVERFQAAKLREAKPKSVKNWMSVLHSILDFGERKGVVGSNVAALVERPDIPKRTEITVLSTSDITAIRDACPDTDLGRTDSTMIVVSARSGLRQGESIALRWKHIDWDTGWIRVTKSYGRGEHKNPKGGKARAMPMPDEVKDALMEHFKRSRRNRENDLVFPHPVTGNELDASKLLKRFKAAVIRSGIRETEKRIYKTSRGATVEREFTNVKWHDLRHAFATFCAAQGIPMRTIQEWIGHEDFETLRIYMHYAPSGFEVDLLNRAIEQEKAGGVGAPQIAPNLKPGGRG